MSKSRRTEIRPIRDAALRMVQEFGLEQPVLRLLAHEFNTTFRVRDARGRQFALRVNTNSVRSEEEMRAEVAWVSALSAETDLRVPTPQPKAAGGYIAETYSAPMQRSLKGVLFEWLPGPNVGEKGTPEITREMGRSLAVMHKHAADFILPPGAALKPLKDCKFGADLVVGQVPGVDESVFAEVADGANKVLARLQQRPQIPIHFDLHMWNVKWHKGQLAIFDFDDSLMGTPVMDAFISLFYLRRGGEDLEAGFWEGLGCEAADLGVSGEEFELLVASRQVALANELLRMETGGLAKVATEYAPVAELRLRHFLSEGRFDPKVAAKP